MSTTETMQMPTLGQAGEPCAGCGAPLAADQRYCLNCGQRRAGPRVDYQRYLAPGPEHAAPQAAEPPQATATSQPISTPEPSRPERDFAPLAAVGGIAVLGLMLLVGVLIGRGTESPSTSPPQVITVGGSGDGETASAGTGGSSTAPGSKEAAGKSNGKNDTGAKAVAGGLTGEAARQSEDTVQASKDDLEALNEQSGESYEETVKKLPDKIATPGKPPPTDNKAPGGGGGALTIE